MVLKIAVVGAGIIGCSVALHLCDSLDPKSVIIEILSEKFTPDTTSDAAGAILIPFDVTTNAAGSTNEEKGKIKRWTEEGFRFFSDLHKSELSGIIDIQLTNGYYGGTTGMLSKDTVSLLSDLAIGFREVGAEERERMNIPEVFEKVYNFSTYIINIKKLLPWMMERIREKGGTFVQRKVVDLSDLKDYDIVINCTGMGAYELVGDTSVYPGHGDAAVVRAPWVKHFFTLINKKEYTYVFPRSNDVLLGGTCRIGDWSTAADQPSVINIVRKCTQIVPSLTNAEVLYTHAGLRPVRDQIRLEKDLSQTDNPLVIHCYGHGGQGVLLAWGSALDVGRIVHDYVNKKPVYKSKL